MPERETPGTVRLDKWLWAARFYKTRALAVEAIDGGKVDVNGQGAKRAKAVRVGDRIQFRQPPYEWDVAVRGLSERRGPASVAVTLYEETDREPRGARDDGAPAQEPAAAAVPRKGEAGQETTEGD